MSESGLEKTACHINRSDEMNLNVSSNLIVSQQVTAVVEEGSGDDRDELTRASYHALSLLDVPAIMV